MTRDLKKLNICLIGVGKVGSALAFELIEKGFNLNYLIDSNRKNFKYFSLINNELHCENKIEPEFIRNSDMIIISVQDKYLKIIVSDLKKTGLNFKDKYIYHTSGFHTSDIFSKLNADVSNIGSFHPIQTFNKISFTNNHLLNNIYWGIEAGKNLKNILVKIVHKFEAKYIIVPKGDKPLCHLACVYASNFLITYLNKLDSMLAGTKLEPIKNINIFLPIINRTIQNLNEQGLEKSLTGPFVRKDFDVIKGHLELLEKNFRELIPIYLYFGKSAINLSSAKSNSSKKDTDTLKSILNKYEKQFRH
jgi:predicted short-subunit dehydrogenase-like oxidoreductase (DUF2520 family)